MSDTLLKAWLVKSYATNLFFAFLGKDDIMEVTSYWYYQVMKAHLHEGKGCVCFLVLTPLSTAVPTT